jgi:hypothetical protein
LLVTADDSYKVYISISISISLFSFISTCISLKVNLFRYPAVKKDSRFLEYTYLFIFIHIHIHIHIQKLSGINKWSQDVRFSPKIKLKEGESEDKLKARERERQRIAVSSHYNKVFIYDFSNAAAKKEEKGKEEKAPLHICSRLVMDM